MRAAVEAGLLTVHALDGHVRVDWMREPGGLASNRLSTLAFDRSLNLWVGTSGGGLSRLAPDGTWSVVNQFDGLTSGFDLRARGAG